LLVEFLCDSLDSFGSNIDRTFMITVSIHEKRPEVIYTESGHTRTNPHNPQLCSLQMKGILANSTSLEVETVDHHPMYKISCRQPLRCRRHSDGEGMSPTRQD
jgi:hypothetical protein